MSDTGRVPADHHALDVQAVADRLGVDLATGLSQEEARIRLRRDGPNLIEQAEQRTWIERIADQFRDPLVVLLLVAITISTAAWVLEGAESVPVEPIAIAAIVVLNATLGAVQSNRADRAAAALRDLSATKAHVVRDGRPAVVDASDVVVGDLLEVSAGDVVAADGRVVAGIGLQIAEAALTGESEPVAKDEAAVPAGSALGDRTSMVFAGTSVVAGNGRVAVVGTGMGTEVGRIASLLDETERVRTPLEREISSIGKLLGSLVIGIAVVVVATLLLVSDLESTSDVIDILLVGVSLAVAAVPEGLPAVLSIVLAIGVQRMAGRNALVKRLASAETLGAATTICTDKTGTLTRGEMTVATLLVGDARLDVAATGHRADGDEAGSTAAQVEELLATAVLACDATVERVDGEWRAIGNPTEAALVAAAIAAGLDIADLVARPRLGTLPFSSDRKRMSVLVADADPHGDEAGLLVVKGAPDVLLARCTAEQTATGPTALSEKRRERWEASIADLASDGMRTLAVARRRLPVRSLEETDETELEWLGLLGINDPPREEAAASVGAAQRSGIRVLMITGDHPDTARRIAEAVGITDADGRVVSGVEIDELDEDELVEVATRASVFARVAPAHKLRLVRALQATGEVVAMTGDGVNDAPALKAADIGTAMGVTGTDAAREAADMILLDDNFETIVTAVSEGRTIFHNVRSFLRYLLSSNVGEVLTVFLGIVFAGVIGLDGDGILTPLTATQILWINLLTDTGPALALGVDPVDRRLMLLPPRSVHARVIDGPMQRGILLVGGTMAAVTLLMIDMKLPGGLVEGDAGIDEARSAAFTVLVLAQLFNCFSARSDLVSARHGWRVNPLLLGAVGFALVLQVLVVHTPLLNDAFATTPLSLGDWLLSAVLASAVLWVSEVRKWLRRRTT